MEWAGTAMSLGWRIGIYGTRSGVAGLFFRYAMEKNVLYGGRLSVARMHSYK